MKIDVWNHVVGPSYMSQFRAQGQRGLAPFAIAQKALWDVDARLRSIETYDGYRQILAPLPGPHVFPGVSGAAAVDLVRRNNEEMAEIVRRHPDHFPGWVAASPTSNTPPPTGPPERPSSKATPGASSWPTPPPLARIVAARLQAMSFGSAGGQYRSGD